MEAVKTENLFKYSKREDYLNVISHGLGVILSIVGMIVLLVNNLDARISVIIGIIIYGVSMTALFLASSLYHYEQNPERRGVLKRFDHAMILIMISGTYAPFCIIMNTKLSYAILVVVYILSIIGIILKVKYINVSNVVSIAIYLIVGWLAIFMLKDMMVAFETKVIVMMVAGGIVYSVGALVYAFTKFEFHHALWHFFVLVAAILFYIAVYIAL